MFVVIFYGASLSGTVLIPYAKAGGFATEAEAAAWVANQQSPQNYLIARSFSPPTNPPSTPITPSTITPGQWVSCFMSFDITGGAVVYVYGAFANQAAAEAWMANNLNPQSYMATLVQTAA